MTEINTTPATVVNLRDAKREQAAAKKAASPKPAPAKKATAAKAPAKAAPKIKWTPKGEKDPKTGECESIGVLGDRQYEITRNADGGKFTATVKTGKGKPRTLVEDTTGKLAWARCVEDARSVTA
jgi:hypothetical protein